MKSIGLRREIFLENNLEPALNALEREGFREIWVFRLNFKFNITSLDAIQKKEIDKYF